jgi:hypothetical protein
VELKHIRERAASKTLEPGVAAASGLREATREERPSDGGPDGRRSEASLENKRVISGKSSIGVDNSYQHEKNVKKKERKEMAGQ